MKIVQKYGGSSLADGECLRRVAQRIGMDAENNRIAVVVSAQGKTTDALTGKYKEISNCFPTRESDALLISGEQASAALLAATLCDMGYKAVSLNGMQVPIYVSGKHGDGRIRNIDVSRIYREWKQGNIVVVTGFQGINDRGDFITLGRGGSDTSAVALAAALKADRCMIFTDVDGVYSADPRKEPRATRFESVHPDTMVDLATNGAKVLHPRAAALIKQYYLPTEVLTSFSRRNGTIISPDAPRRTGVTATDQGTVSIVTVVAERPFTGECLKKLLILLNEYGASIQYINCILQGIVASQSVSELMEKIHRILYPA